MPAHPTSFPSRLLPAFSASIACWALLLSVPPLMRWENGMQRIMAKVFYPSHQRINGMGTHEEPLSMVKIEENAKVVPPFIVEMGEDPDRIFDSRPLSPSDNAVLLDAMKKSGVSSVMFAHPMAWSAPDPFAIDALEWVTSGFSSCVTSAPLGRGTEAEPMPPALVRASVRVSRMIGSAASLPVVNRVTVAGTYLGRENTWAGFSEIESETATPGLSWLIARWGDRVVFSSALLAVLQRENIHPEELMIEPGQSIQSPRTGHFWEIDVHGRGSVQRMPVRAPDLQAPQLIRPEPEHLAKLVQHKPPVHLLRSDDPTGEAEPTQQLLQTLYSAPRLVGRVTWQRLSMMGEFAIVSLLAFQAVVVAGFVRKTRVWAVVVVALLWLVALRWGNTWLPVSPALLAFFVAYRLAPRAPVVAAPRPSPLATNATPPKPQPSPQAKKSPRKQGKKSSRGKKKS